MIKSMSLFSQILSEISSSSVSLEHLVMKHGNDRNAKGFTSKAQLVAMIFSHLARADSLLDISNGLLCCTDKVKHLGIKTVVFPQYFFSISIIMSSRNLGRSAADNAIY